MKAPLLSICIATYNRAGYIGETLESIISQVTDEVEIVIVDGASTDGTTAVVKRYAEVCKQINYIRLPSKGGVDQDYCKAVDFAKGEYCWLFPDDDLLKPDAISTVLNEIPKGYSLIVVNAQVMNRDFSKIIENKRLQIDKNEIYSESELELLFDHAVLYMSFIGCVVINRDLWIQREKKRYFGTEFIHVGVIFQTPLPAPALLIAEPYIIIRHGNAQWTPRAVEIWMFKWPNLIFSFAHIPEQIRKKHQIKSWRRLKNIIMFRAMGAYSLKEYQNLFTSSKDLSLWWKFFALLTAIVPSIILKLAIRCKKDLITSLSYFVWLKKIYIRGMCRIKHGGFIGLASTIIRKSFEVIVHPRAKGFKQLRELIIAKKGLEVGGPSRVFSKSGLMPIYEIANRVDNCNFGQRTIWEGVLGEGEHFRYGRGAVLGHQYIREATDLHGISSKEYDFVCSADVIEHIANPLQAIFEWVRVLKDDGIIIIIVPHKQRTFDHKRPVTLLDHLIEDYTCVTTEDDTTHIGEVLELHDLSMDPLAGSFEEFKERTLNNFQNRAVHQHVFDVDLVINMLNYAGIQICNIEVCRPHSIVVIGKKLVNRQKIDNSTFLNKSSKIWI